MKKFKSWDRNEYLQTVVDLKWIGSEKENLITYRKKGTGDSGHNGQEELGDNNFGSKTLVKFTEKYSGYNSQIRG